MTYDLLDNAPCGFIAFRDNKEIVYANGTILSWLGYREKITGRNIEDILTIATRIFFNTHFFPLLTLRDAVSEIFMQLCDINNTIFNVLVNSKNRID